MKRSMPFLVVCAASCVLSAPAFAGDAAVPVVEPVVTQAPAPSAEASTVVSSPAPAAPATTVTEAPATTVTEVPATSTDVPATATTSVTDVPGATTTDVPVTTTTDVPVTTATDVPVSDVASTTTLPMTADTGVDDCVTGCIPTDTLPSAVAGAGVVPTAGYGSRYGSRYAGGMLPYTGIEEAIAAVLLALTVVLGGVVAWRWAQLRESVAADASARALGRAVVMTDRPSGYQPELRRGLIELRARQMFTPRVA